MARVPELSMQPFVVYNVAEVVTSDGMYGKANLLIVQLVLPVTGLS